MKRTFLLFLLTGILGSAFPTGATAQDKPALTFQDYAKWSRLSRAVLSPDGQWVSYSQTPNGGDVTLFIRNVDTDSVYQVDYANGAVFSDDGRWAAYTVGVANKEAKKLREARKEVPAKTVLKNLESGEEQAVENSARFSFSNDSKHFVVHKRKASEDKSKHSGADLILRNLNTGQVLNIGNVQQFAFNQSATRLAYTVDADGQVGNGLYLVDLSDYSIRVLDTDEATYSQLTWDDAGSHRRDWASKGTGIAVLKGNKADSLVHRANQIVVVQGIGTKNQTLRTFKTDEWADFPGGQVISENGSLRWSDNGEMVFFGFREQEPALKLSRDTVANVDVWHWKDELIQSVQIRRAPMLRRMTTTSVLHLKDGRFVQLGDENLRSVQITKHPRYAIARDDRKYVTDVSWGESPADLYRIDLHTGERQLFAEYVASRPLGASPDGRYYLYFFEGDMQLYDVDKGEVRNLSAGLPVSFADRDHPYPNAVPTYGLAGWTKDGRSVVVNHHYDLWLLPLNGSGARNLTGGFGDAEEIRLRYVNLDPEEEYIDLKKDLLLSAYGEWTKRTGYFLVKDGQQPREVIYEDFNISRPLKARDADRLVYTIQSFTQFPDYQVSGLDFKNPKQVSDANPQQADYAWGERRVLIDYTNSKGDRLQGTLALPAGYEPGKKYPMIVYFYEKMSQNHHVYSAPVYDDRPHMSYYASNGYLVFQPDNVYEEGYPGTSALDCITSAVQEVIDQGYADPARIGLQGHSWGGYQSSFIVTQTDMFACVVTGAPPTNLEGFYNNLYGSTGTNHHGITEIGQIRMGRNVTPWSHREAYQRENPMFHADKIQTPFMILHGTADGAVDWAQGMEFYNAARRLGKEVIFLSYPGEGHHLENEANAKDFQLRMSQYFDHYLKDAEAPAWMVDGIPNLQKLYDKAK